MDFYCGPGEFSQSWDLVLDSDEEVDVYYFEIGSPQQPPQETEFQTLHNSITITNEAGDTLMIEGTIHFLITGRVLFSRSAPQNGMCTTSLRTAELAVYHTFTVAWT